MAEVNEELINTLLSYNVPKDSVQAIAQGIQNLTLFYKEYHGSVTRDEIDAFHNDILNKIKNFPKQPNSFVVEINPELLKKIAPPTSDLIKFLKQHAELSSSFGDENGLKKNKWLGFKTRHGFPFPNKDFRILNTVIDAQDKLQNAKKNLAILKLQYDTKIDNNEKYMQHFQQKIESGDWHYITSINFLMPILIKTNPLPSFQILKDFLDIPGKISHKDAIPLGCELLGSLLKLKVVDEQKLSRIRSALNPEYLSHHERLFSILDSNNFEKISVPLMDILLATAQAIANMSLNDDDYDANKIQKLLKEQKVWLDHSVIVLQVCQTILDVRDNLLSLYHSKWTKDNLVQQFLSVILSTPSEENLIIFLNEILDNLFKPNQLLHCWESYLSSPTSTDTHIREYKLETNFAGYISCNSTSNQLNKINYLVENADILFSLLQKLKRFNDARELAKLMFKQKNDPSYLIRCESFFTDSKEKLEIFDLLKEHYSEQLHYLCKSILLNPKNDLTDAQKIELEYVAMMSLATISDVELRKIRFTENYSAVERATDLDKLKDKNWTLQIELEQLRSENKKLNSKNKDLEQKIEQLQPEKQDDTPGKRYDHMFF